MWTIPESWRPPISRRANRALHLGIAFLMTAWLGLCALVQPEPSGVGTHKRFGLPGCLVCRVTGMERCPSCGLTTGFSHIMHGRWTQAGAVHPAAQTVFLLWCLLLAYCLLVTVLGANRIAYEVPAFALLCTTGLIFWVSAL